MQRALAWLFHEYNRIDIIDEAGCPMTAEIAILNRNAVVLATDSAITSMVPSTSHGRVPKISIMQTSYLRYRILTRWL